MFLELQSLECSESLTSIYSVIDSMTQPPPHSEAHDKRFLVSQAPWHSLHRAVMHLNSTLSVIASHPPIVPHDSSDDCRLHVADL